MCNKFINFLPRERERGQAMLVTIVFFLFLGLAVVTGLVVSPVREFKNAGLSVNSRQAYYLAESGVEDAYYRLLTDLPISANEILTLGGNSATTTIITSGNVKEVIVLGGVENSERKIKLLLKTGTGVSFKYGIQAGVGGFVMKNNAGVNGNVYSNGTVIGASGAVITGSAFSVGSSGLIRAVTVGQNGVGDAWARTVNETTVAGNLYCQTGTGNNKPCNTSKPDPTPAPMPITQAMIDKWQADAALGGTVTGNLTISTPTTLGPKKITGNLAINKDLTITGTIYVVGNITTGNNVKISLDSSYGATGGIIVSDGLVTLSNNATFYGSGHPDSYVLMATTSACPTTGCTNSNALEILNNVGAVLVNAQNGAAHLNNNVTLNEVVGNKIIIDNNAVVNYTFGLADLSFVSGPTGGWHIDSWKEIK
jgi:hypothetical protein